MGNLLKGGSSYQLSATQRHALSSFGMLFRKVNCGSVVKDTVKELTPPNATRLN